MENLIFETNSRLQEIINNLSTIKKEYTNKLTANTEDIERQLKTVDSYREEFFTSKRKIEKMNADIEGFEEDYKKLVERFQDDELANILVAANKEISAKIEERKRKILRDRQAMNELVEKAEDVKQKLVKLTAEKKALELCLTKINDSYEFYSKALSQVIDYSSNNQDNLCACFYEDDEDDNTETVIERKKEETKAELHKIIDSVKNNDEEVEEENLEESDLIPEEEIIDGITEQPFEDDFEEEIVIEEVEEEEEIIEEENEIQEEEIEEEVQEEVFEEDDELDLDEIEEISVEDKDKKNKKKDKEDKKNFELDEDFDLNLEDIINFNDELED